MHQVIFCSFSCSLFLQNPNPGQQQIFPVTFSKLFLKSYPRLGGKRFDSNAIFWIGKKSYMSYILRRSLPDYTNIWGNPLEVRSARRKLALETCPCRRHQGSGLIFAFPVTLSKAGLLSHLSKSIFLMR